MSRFLGFASGSQILCIYLSFKRQNWVMENVANSKPNIHAFTQKSVNVTCNIVQDTKFGGDRLKLLQLITNGNNQLNMTQCIIISNMMNILFLGHKILIE